MEGSTDEVTSLPRSQLGPELQVVVLDMALEDQVERVRERNKGEESAVDMCKVAITNALSVTPCPGNLCNQ